MRGPVAMRSMSACVLVLLIGVGIASAAPPGEVQLVVVRQDSRISWVLVPGATDYNVYRGLASSLPRGTGARCHGDEIVGNTFSSPSTPPPGDAFFYLVTAESDADGEGTPGAGTGGAPRTLRGTCDAVMRHHVLNRIGFGGDEWSRSRIATLGLQGYLDEQLDPAAIDESSNSDLLNRRAALYPPDSGDKLLAYDVVNAVYARRQLEQQATMFWDNHFNTNYTKTFDYFGFYKALYPAKQGQASGALHDQAQARFRDLAFNGTFRDILEASGLSVPMVLYLDTARNIASAPNENYARELLELHSMGVDGGYTQQDIVQLARVFSGWTVCKKNFTVAADPLSACIPSNTYGTASEPPGAWVSYFSPGQHDPTQKTLFAGTPYEAVIPSTAGNPAAGVDDVQLAFDAIAAHPSTARFIAKKLLQRFVDEQPTPAMIDAVVAAWNNPANPRGIGDLREVLRAVLAQSAFRDPDRIAGKVKRPFVHIVSALRAVRGLTDGQSGVRDFLERMSELLHRNPVPTGFPEVGGEWIDTNNLIERQNFGLFMAIRTTSNLGTDVIGLLNAAGVSTAATPDNAPAIVDFLSGVLYGGALDASERQRAIDYLHTDDLGNVTNYSDSRIRETLGFMLGYPQFLEQ